MNTGLPKKMLLEPGNRLLAIDAPEGFVAANLADLPGGATVTEADSDGTGAFDAVLFFAADAAALAAGTPAALRAVRPDGLLWIGFPKGSSKRQTDLTRDRGWESLTAAGYEFVSLISLDDVWSGARVKLIDPNRKSVREIKREW